MRIGNYLDISYTITVLRKIIIDLESPSLWKSGATQTKFTYAFRARYANVDY